MSQIRSVLDKLLTQASNMLVPEGFVCEEILPAVFVEQKTGRLGKFGTNHLRVEATIAGGRGLYRTVDSVTRDVTTTYHVDSHGLNDICTPDDYSNVYAPFDAEQDIVKALTTLLYIKKEYALASTLTSTSIITQYTTLTSANQYSDKINCSPIADWETARQAIRNGCGFPPNIAVMDWQVYNKIKALPQIMDLLGYKYARPGGLTDTEMNVALGVDKVLIARSVYESAKEGQTSNLQPIWGKDIVFAYSPDQATRYQTALGYRVQLTGQRGAPRRVYKYPIYNPPESTGIICEDSWDMLISNAACAYLIKAAIA